MENQKVRDYVEDFFGAAYSYLAITDPAGRVDRLPGIVQLPNYNIDLDAPKLPYSESSGIVIHGDGALQDQIRNFLSQCFIAKKTQKTVDGLSEYYKKNVIWIEIGLGIPWKNSSICPV